MKYKKSDRQWLNPRDSDDTGSVSWEVEACQDSAWVDASFTLRDCSRTIQLNFDYTFANNADDRAKKIDLLIKALQDFKAAMGEAYTVYDPTAEYEAEVLLLEDL